MRYFSLPYEGSGVNFGLDTIREEEHRKAKKYFRPRADATTIENRMKRMEEANEIHEEREECLYPNRKSTSPTNDHSNWNIT
jgi:hypothetical protein